MLMKMKQGLVSLKTKAVALSMAVGLSTVAGTASADTLETMVTAIDFTPIISVLATAGLAIIGLVLAMKGVQIVISMVRRA